MSSALARLRPRPHRGDVIAAGAVPLALAAVMIELRMIQWSLGLRFVVVAPVALLLLTMGWLAELELETPRAYHSILLITGLLTLAVALVLLAELLGARRPPGAGGFAWTFALEAVVAAAAARRANSGVCTLIAALAAGIALEAFVAWVFQPHGPGTFRAILFALTLVYAAGAVRLRDRRRRHAVALVDAAALAALAVAATYLYVAAISSLLRASGAFLTVFGGSQTAAPFGWKLFLLAVGFGLLAYAAADREPGPAYLGTVVLLSFVLLAGSPGPHRGSLVGWPLFLLVIGVAGLAVGLRPSKPLPPPPAATTSTPAQTIPLHPEEAE